MDDAIDDTIAASLRPLYVEADRQARGADEAWLLTHRPITAIVSSTYLPSPPGTATPWTSLTNTFASSELLGGYDLMLSSHLHLAQAVQIPGLPGEIILGNAGALLDAPTGYEIPEFGPLADANGVPLTTAVPQIPTAKSITTWVRYGYALVTPAKSGWNFELKGVDGARFATCRAGSGDLVCS